MVLPAGRWGLIVPMVLIALGIFAATVSVVAYHPLSAFALRQREWDQRTTTDELTGLQNRRQIVERLAAELNRAVRSGQPLSCALVDIDGFREVNDKFGQEAGDSVLRTVANLIAESCRQYDTAGRYGGEEFLVILPAAELDDAARAAERLRRRIESGQFACHGQSFTVTVSVGLTQADIGATETTDVLIARASKALECAMTEGRNRVSALATLALVERTVTPPPAPSAPPGRSPVRV
jgi:diguanylate cyclase (GGDEF)-like protein